MVQFYIWNGTRWVRHPANAVVVVPGGTLILIITVSIL